MHSAALKVGVDASIPISGYQNIVTGEPYILLALRLPTTLDKNIIGNYPTLNDIYIGFGLQMSW
ncbi:hypothetical protein OFR28_08385 [Brachyspira hyodysenteriae]|nr:hypothetical protein [Brachyspira hyodysenteriae]MCZ9989846.1 hypothetical protein [Brachyspira hyodysenteriae]MCZ9998214.1 hypothetical protein [Brachyspira hyodysenteriae]MDA0001648.1 hypothetical protein [Brachyspira hyodysenteriae]